MSLTNKEMDEVETLVFSMCANDEPLARAILELKRIRGDALSLHEAWLCRLRAQRENVLAAARNYYRKRGLDQSAFALEQAAGKLIDIEGQKP